MSVIRAGLIFLMLSLPVSAFAQGLTVAFGDLQQDPDAPVEVSADSLTVDQADGSATFVGNVRIAQGTMRMAAKKVNVYYNADTQGISRLVGTGDVTIVNGADAAEAAEATYDLDAGTILMTGTVLLTQKLNSISADRMLVDLNTNSAEMHGRVKTVLKSGDN